ncbi:MAG: hypothetical protein J3K34DRAFT_405681 [Monoraphidium minutum]|nr:MAG: hypothetical protein J3K34DRAFT_405681 [Monoraphidium minutum]
MIHGERAHTHKYACCPDQGAGCWRLGHAALKVMLGVRPAGPRDATGRHTAGAGGRAPAGRRWVQGGRAPCWAWGAVPWQIRAGGRRARRACPPLGAAPAPGVGCGLDGHALRRALELMRRSLSSGRPRGCVWARCCGRARRGVPRALRGGTRENKCDEPKRMARFVGGRAGDEGRCKPACGEQRSCGTVEQCWGLGFGGHGGSGQVGGVGGWHMGGLRCQFRDLSAAQGSPPPPGPRSGGGGGRGAMRKHRNGVPPSRWFKPPGGRPSAHYAVAVAPAGGQPPRLGVEGVQAAAARDAMAQEGTPARPARCKNGRGRGGACTRRWCGPTPCSAQSPPAQCSIKETCCRGSSGRRGWRRTHHHPPRPHRGRQARRQRSACCRPPRPSRC